MVPLQIVGHIYVSRVEGVVAAPMQPTPVSAFANQQLHSSQRYIMLLSSDSDTMINLSKRHYIVMYASCSIALLPQIHQPYYQQKCAVQCNYILCERHFVEIFVFIVSWRGLITPFIQDHLLVVGANHKNDNNNITKQTHLYMYSSGVDCHGRWMTMILFISIVILVLCQHINC